MSNKFKPNNKRWTLAEKRLVLNMHQKGWNHEDIMKKTGKSVEKIKALIGRFKV